MKVLNTIESVRAWRRTLDAPPAFVPTMGALHQGHEHLILTAVQTGAPTIISIYVNPLQFGPGEDFLQYPRTMDADIAMAARTGCAAVWIPQQQELTPATMKISVDPGSMARQLCGAWRPGHFTGVATIVLKLFEIVRPGQAYFGWKDAQQFVILRKMVEDLNLDIEMHGVETVRESSGLAMSSRNRYLPENLRHEAAELGRTLLEVKEWALASGGVVPAQHAIERVKTRLATMPNLEEIQYVEAVSLSNLEQLNSTQIGNTLLAAAVRYPQARLIDNVRW